MGGGGGGAEAASPAGPRGEGGRLEWLRIYDRMVVMVRKSQTQAEAFAADCARLEAFAKIQHDFWFARVDLLQDRLRQMRRAEESRRRCEAANVELLLGDKEREARCYQKLAELTENDLEDFRTSVAALAAENSELKIKLKEAEIHAELSENTMDHEHSARDLRAELRKLKQAYKTLSSKRDKEVSALHAEKDFVWNQLRTMEQDYTALLKNKKIEAAQATEAAQKLHQNVEELQVAAQNKDDEIDRLRAEAVDAKKKIPILEDKLQEMCSLAKEKDAEIGKLKGDIHKFKKDIDESHRKSRSEGPAVRGKSRNSQVTPLRRKVKASRMCASSAKQIESQSRNNFCRQKVEEGGQPETSQKRKRTSSLANAA